MASPIPTRPRLTYANVVATLALFIALGGTGYAISQLPKNSVKSKQIARNAVKSAEVAGNAIRSGDVRDGSLLFGDFAPGQLPAGPVGPVGPTFAAFDGENLDPVANPDPQAIMLDEDITTPAAGRLLVFFTASEGFGSDGLSVSCTTAVNPTAGLYVDGVAVPGTRMTLNQSVGQQQSQFGVTADVLPAGPHQIALFVDCGAGTYSGGILTNNRSFGAILLGG